MLSNGFAGPLALRRRPSTILTVYLVCLHGLAALALLQPLELVPSVRVCLWLMLIVSGLYHWRYARQQCDAAQYWVWSDKGGWQYGDDPRAYTLRAGKSVATPWFVTLALSSPGQKIQRLLIVRDQLEPDTFRRLRVRIRLSYEVSEASGADSG